MAAETETTLKMFHSPDRDVALKSEERFRGAKTLPGNYNLALQAFASFEWHLRDAIQPFATEVFRGALNRRSSGLQEQTHWPMQCYSLTFAAVIR